MWHAQCIRTTLEIDENLLLTVKGIARQNSTAGAVVSRLLRALLQPAPVSPEYRNGIPLLPRRPDGITVTSELVNRLRDEDE